MTMLNARQEGSLFLLGLRLPKIKDFLSLYLKLQVFPSLYLFCAENSAYGCQGEMGEGRFCNHWQWYLMI